MSNIDNISHPTAKYFADILSPIVANTPRRVKNSEDAASKPNLDLTVTPGQKLVSTTNNSNNTTREHVLHSHETYLD